MALTNAGLFFTISANSDKATAEFIKLRKEFKETETQIKKSSGIIETAFLGFAQGAGLSGKEAAFLKANLKDMAKVATVAAAAIAAVGGAAAAAAFGMFKLASEAAEAGSKIYDVTVKTGLAAETVSTLKLAADKSGVSMESLGTIVSRFSKVVGEAAQGSKEANETLTRLGIEPKEAINDLDGALGKVFKTIHDLPDPISKATLAQQAFGKSGTELLKVIDDFKGDLPAAIAEAKRLGLTMSGDNVKAADEWADQMQVVERQLEMVKIKIGQGLMPVFLDWSKKTSTWLAANQGEVSRWGTNFANVLSIVATGLSNVKTGLDEFDDLLRAALAGDTWEQFKQRVAARASADAAGTAIGGGGLDTKTFTITPSAPGQAAPPQATQSDALTNFDEIEKKRKEAEDAAKKAEKEAEDLRKRQLQGQLGQLKALQDAEEHSLERITAALKAEFEERRITAKQFLDRRLEDEENFAKQAIADIEKEYDLRRQQEHLSAEQLKALKIEEDNELQKVVDTRYEREEQAKKDANERTKKLSEEALSAAKDSMERSIALFEAESDKRYAVVVEYADKEKRSAEDVAKFKEFLEVSSLEYRLAKLREYAEKVDKNSKEYLDLVNQIKILELKLEQQRSENHTADQKRHDERIRSWNEYIEKVIQATEAEDARREKNAADQAAADRRKLEKEGGLGTLGESIGVSAGGLSPISIFGDQDTLKSEADFIKDVWTDLEGHIGGAIGNMVNGLASMAAAWLATGKFSAKAALQMASSIALSLAMQAGVAAIMEIARGYAEAAASAASYAVGDVAGGTAHAIASGLHFSAAAVYGTVAGIAAAVGVGTGLAARAFGDESSRATGGATAGGSTRHASNNVEGQGQAYSSQKDGIREAGRNAPQTLVIEERDGGLAKLFNFHIKNNSELRDTIRTVAAT